MRLPTVSKSIPIYKKHSRLSHNEVTHEVWKAFLCSLEIGDSFYTTTRQEKIRKAAYEINVGITIRPEPKTQGNRIWKIK